jgi:hypothetical protein
LSKYGEFRVIFPLILWLATWALFFRPENVLFIIPSSLPGCENLQTPRPLKKNWVKLSLHFTGEILAKSQIKI